MTVPWSRAALEQGSFVGWIPFRDLPSAQVPEAPGVYAVFRPSAEPPRFLESSDAGRFRQKDPTVAPAVLERKWVDGAEVLYIGRATAGPAGRRGLRRRLDEYRRYGAGEPVAHSGGRFVWQLEDRDDVLVAWNATEEAPALVEARMLRDFEHHYGRRPFANLRR